MLAATDDDGLDAEAHRLREHVLRDFRRAGVDRSEEDRDRLRALAQRCTELGLEFSRNIRDGVRSVQVRPEQLDGLPDDFRAEHPADDDGLVTLTTEYPDLLPVRTYAHDAVGAAGAHHGAPADRVAGQRADPRGAAAAARRAGHAPGLPGLADVRRRGQDDRLRPGDRRPASTSSTRSPRRRRPGTSTSCSRGTAQDVPDATAVTRGGQPLLRPGHQERAVRRRLPRGPRVLPVRGGASPACWTWCRGCSGSRCSRSTRRRGTTDVEVYDVTDDGRAHRPRVPRHAPAAGEVQPRRPVPAGARASPAGPCPRACWCATSRPV